MDSAAALIELNRRFYAGFGPSFAATRQRIQNGVRRVLATLPDAPGARWLDLGCGSGALAVEWLRAGRQSAYLGLDFSRELLEAAHTAVAALEADPHLPPPTFHLRDLSSSDWAAGLGDGYAGALAFAVLHHIPGQALRARLLRQAGDLLAPGGLFIHSVWQFQHAPRLMQRRLPWSTVGLDEAALDPGDTLLDWRAPQPGGPERRGLRYVHLFTPAELAALAAESGFEILESFESDGQGGRLGLYQVWRKAQ